MLMLQTNGSLWLVIHVTDSWIWIGPPHLSSLLVYVPLFLICVLKFINGTEGYRFRRYDLQVTHPKMILALANAATEDSLRLVIQVHYFWPGSSVKDQISYDLASWCIIMNTWRSDIIISCWLLGALKGQKYPLIRRTRRPKYHLVCYLWLQRESLATFMLFVTQASPAALMGPFCFGRVIEIDHHNILMWLRQRVTDFYCPEHTKLTALDRDVPNSNLWQRCKLV